MPDTTTLAKKYNLPEETVTEALFNLQDNRVFLVAISGKAYAGKDTTAPEVMKKIGAGNSDRTFFAKPLKDEINEIIDIVRNSYHMEDAVAKVSENMDVTDEDAFESVSIICDEVLADERVSAYTRTPGVRKVTQFWGTNVRRKQNNNYWVERVIGPVLTSLAMGRSVYVTDARFINEVTSVLEVGGTVIRLNISPEAQSERALLRDGIELSEETRSHPSETELDDFQGFTVSVFVDGLTPDEVVAKIIERLNGND